jgi:predicted AAA+ superfamily ATPase
LLLRQSGSLMDYTHLARLSDVSRHTVKAHVEAMGIAHAVFLLPPFQGGGRREITRRPKCYCFDTGFVTFVKGWDSIREDDRGLLWEHLVLDTLRTVVDDHTLRYWRDKSGREVDFVIRGSRQQADAIECKINPDRFDPAHLAVFRSLYPGGKNYVVSPAVKASYQRRYGEQTVHFISIEQLSDVTAS